MTSSPIGLIGLGLLGSALAERMLAAGHALVACDLDPERLRQLPQIEAVASAAEIARRSRSIVLCLPDSLVVRSVVESMGEALASGSLVIDATTGDPDDTVRLAAELRRRQVGYVDATIAGSSEQVRRGEAAVLVGGEAADVAAAQPILSAWCAARFHLGPSGSGTRMKLVVNLVLGLNRAVLAEGLSLAEACGIAPAAALAVLKATPARSAVMETKGAKMVARDFTPQARLSQHCKDVELIRQLARRHSATTPLSDVHAYLLAQAAAAGWGEADNSAILEAFRAAR